MIIVPEAMTTLEGERREDNSFFEVSNRDWRTKIEITNLKWQLSSKERVTMTMTLALCFVSGIMNKYYEIYDTKRVKKYNIFKII